MTADLASRGFLYLVGLVLIVSTTLSMLRTVIVPRPLHSTFTDAVVWFVKSTGRGLARLRRSYDGRDSTLAWIGPLIILGLLISWIIGYLIGFGLLLYGTGANNLIDAMRQSGSSLFTLGFASSHLEDQTVIDFVAAMTGPIVIGMMIGYLPTVYSAYLERERHVTLLSDVAGEPAWGVEFLSRAALVGNIDAIDATFDEWAIWAANQRLVLTTYPALIYVRSPRSTRHWAISLLSMLDAASLIAALHTDLAHRGTARVILQGSQAFEAIWLTEFAKRHWTSHVPGLRQLTLHREQPRAQMRPIPSLNEERLAVHMASALDADRGMQSGNSDVLHRAEDRGTTLSRADFDAAVDMLRRSGFPMINDPDAAWEYFSDLRSRYEFPAYAIIEDLDAVPAPWSGPRRIATPTIYPHLALDQLRKSEN